MLYQKYLVGAILLLIPGIVFGRAGDGHGGYESNSSNESSYDDSYSGYKTSSNSSSSSTTTSGDLIWLISMFVLIVISASIAYKLSPNIRKEINGIVSGLRQNEGMSASYSPTDTGTSMDVDSQKNKLHELDPLWDEQKFRELVNIGFFKIQQAWSDSDMSSARAYISDTIMQRFLLQLKPYQLKNQKNVLGQLSLDSIDIINIQIDESHTHITTLIQATCTDTIIDIGTGVVVASNYGGALSTWREKWIWTRSNSAKSKAMEEGVFVHKCPSCGAPLNINAVGKCEYCNSELTKGDFDWVLSQIIQVN